MKKEFIIAELARLYELKEEGKRVDNLIAELETKLFALLEGDADEEEDQPEV